MKNTLETALKYFHTIKYLKPVQIYGQIKFRLYKPSFVIRATPSVRTRPQGWITPVSKAVSMSSHNHITFLNQEKNISSPVIWNADGIDKLWLYNLHYFDVLKSIANDEQKIWQTRLLERWVKENPPAHRSNGWEPYTISLRIVNWVKWLLVENKPDAALLQSLATQARYLAKRLEIHIQGNHLLANAKALLFAGCYFTGAEASIWLRRGTTLFSRQLNKQILADGGHFELSPMYHAIILEDLLDVINLFNTYKIKIPANWITHCEKMFKWLQILTHPDTAPAFFNDTAQGIAPGLNELQSYYERLPLPAMDTAAIEPLTCLPSSGYVRIKKDNSVLIADIAPVGADYQPGHAHADTLSFEFSLGKQRLFVNSGTSTYNSNDLRCQQRATAAHNTLTINDTDSSEVWKSFRVARRARVSEVKTGMHAGQVFISASHDGYFHPYKIIHTRQWQMTGNQLLIIDELTGTKKHKVALHFHLHPQIRAAAEHNTIKLYDQHNTHLATLQSVHSLKLLASTYYPEFNLALPSQKILIELVTTLPQRFETLLSWN
jgi:uncharacterized heparinase superfamily protein